MKDYTHFEVEDFLMDDDFIDWINHPDSESNRFWNLCLVEHPAQRLKIEIAASTIKSLSYQTNNIPETFYATLKHDIDTTISNTVSAKNYSPVFKMGAWLKVAAAFIAIVVGLAVVYVYLQPAATIKVVTAYKQVKTFELPDHSLVTLNANSSLEYPKNWDNDKRNVTLTGEGFFKITHLEKQNSARKFTVHADKVDVEVLGTEFNVKNRGQLTGIMLQTGKVQLRIQNIDSIHVMRPNDFISFNKKTKEVTSQSVNPSYYTGWINHRYLFSKVSLREVCDHLETFYRLKFNIENAALANQEISGTLMLEDENSLLQTLSSFLNANISKKGQQVAISSK